MSMLLYSTVFLLPFMNTSRASASVKFLIIFEFLKMLPSVSNITLLFSLLLLNVTFSTTALPLATVTI